MMLQHAVLCSDMLLKHKSLCCGLQGSIAKVLDDIAALRPTLFCGVPRVYDRVYAGIYDQVCDLLLSFGWAWCCTPGQSLKCGSLLLAPIAA